MTSTGIDSGSIEGRLLEGTPNLIHVQWSTFPQGSAHNYDTQFIVFPQGKPEEILLKRGLDKLVSKECLPFTIPIVIF